MGNKNSALKDGIADLKASDIEKQFVWSSSNTKMEVMYETAGKVYAVDARKIEDDEKNDCIVVASVDQSGVVQLTKITFKKNKSGKVQIKYKKLDTVRLSSAWVMAVSLSATTKYLAVGGLDNTVTVYIKNQNNKYQQFTQLNGHTGYIACIKFIDHGSYTENLLLNASGDGTVSLWDVESATRLQHFQDVAQGDCMSVDHIYIENKHIVAFCDIANAVYVRDITDAIQKYEKGDNNNDDDQKKDDKVEKKVKVIFFEANLGQFTNDVNDCKFSRNGEFLAATSDDGSYEIYKKNLRYDMFCDCYILEWTFLAKRDLQEIYKDFGTGNALVWVDQETVMVGCSDTKELFSTYMKQRTSDPEIVKAVKEGVHIIIESLPIGMKWIGLCDTISHEILQCLNEYDVFDYKYKFATSKTRVSCLTSCKWGKNQNENVLIFGCWDQKTRVVFPKQL